MNNLELDTLSDDTIIVLTAKDLKVIAGIAKILYQERTLSGDSQRDMGKSISSIIDNSFELLKQ